jgi:hypothetical protein
MTSTTAPEPVVTTVPPVTCEPWCIYGDGHPDCVLAEDQTCYTEEMIVAVPTYYPSVKGSGETYFSEIVDVYAAQTSGSPAHVDLSLGESDTLKLSLSEARSIAAALIAAADLAEGGSR